MAWKKWVLIFVLLLVSGCSKPQTAFEKDFSKIKEIDKAYNLSLEKYPVDFEEIGMMPLAVSELTLIKQKLSELESSDKAFLTYLSFRVNLIEAETDYKLALALGKKGEVMDGFGCKDKPFIIEAASFRNASAQHGYAATGRLKKLFEEYPEEAALTGLPLSWPVFLNASFREIERKSNSTINFINRICPDN